MTDLDALKALCPPPAVVLPAPDWSRVEGELGMRLPRDYKKLVAAYGLGEFCGFLTLYQPGALSEWVDLTGPMPMWLRGQLDEIPTWSPPCTAADLFAMGVTGNGDHLFWDTRPQGAPEEWTVAVAERLRAPWFTYSGTVTAFLVDVLGGTTRVPLFPLGLLDDGVVFTPSRLRSRVPVTGLTTRSPISTRAIRDWARANGYELPDRGRVPLAIREAWEAAHPGGSADSV
ncbi:Lsr2 family protein [Streptomyces sp. NBC_00572]|nr:Lsr2 family protein [Streptomyces sp. NBC_00572]